jgi:hypothetical protein
LAVFAALILSTFVPGRAQTEFLENKLAKEELALAKTPSLYFIVYLRSRVIALKSRGMTLEEWKVQSLHSWGDAAPLAALTLNKKSALNPPQRTKIKPASSEEEAATAAFELEALELKDMPSRFTLFLTGNIRISIRTKPRGFLPRTGELGHALAWNLWVPLKNLRFRMKKAPFGAVDIKLEKKEEGQSLYWALPDGIKGLVFPL